MENRSDGHQDDKRDFNLFKPPEWSLVDFDASLLAVDTADSQLNPASGRAANLFPTRLLRVKRRPATLSLRLDGSLICQVSEAFVEDTIYRWMKVQQGDFWAL